MSIGALSGVSYFDSYNSSNIQNMYQLMRYRYNINSAMAIRNSSKVTSYLGSQSTATSSSSGVDKTQAFLSLYKKDLEDTQSAADKLSYYKAGNVFSQYTLGSSDEDVAEISTNSLRKSTSFSVSVEKLASDTTPARYSITENGRTTQYTSQSNTIQLQNADATLTLKGTGKTDIYTGIDEDSIVSAMRDMVKSYNNTMETLSLGKNLGSGVYSQYSDMSEKIANGTIMSMVGLSYDKNGDLSLDEDRLKSALERDYETARELIGGQYGIATTLSQKTSDALTQSISSIMGDTGSSLLDSTNSLLGSSASSLLGSSTGSLLGSSAGSLLGSSTGSLLGSTTSSLLGNTSTNSLIGNSNNYGQNYFNLMYDFSKNMPYNYGNSYSIGSLFNLLG